MLVKQREFDLCIVTQFLVGLKNIEPLDEQVANFLSTIPKSADIKGRIVVIETKGSDGVSHKFFLGLIFNTRKQEVVADLNVESGGKFAFFLLSLKSSEKNAGEANHEDGLQPRDSSKPEVEIEVTHSQCLTSSIIAANRHDLGLNEGAYLELNKCPDGLFSATPIKCLEGHVIRSYHILTAQGLVSIQSHLLVGISIPPVSIDVDARKNVGNGIKVVPVCWKDCLGKQKLVENNSVAFQVLKNRHIFIYCE